MENDKAAVHPIVICRLSQSEIRHLPKETQKRLLEIASNIAIENGLYDVAKIREQLDGLSPIDRGKYSDHTEFKLHGIATSLVNRVAELQKEVGFLRAMVDNGLGPQDMEQDR